jgi:hypothetical protein
MQKVICGQVITNGRSSDPKRTRQKKLYSDEVPYTNVVIEHLDSKATKLGEPSMLWIKDIPPLVRDSEC